MPTLPPTPEQIIQETQKQILQMASAVSNNLAPVPLAIDTANKAIEELGRNFTNGINVNLDLIKDAILGAIGKLNQDASNAVGSLHELISNLPGGDAIKDAVLSGFGKITINNNDIGTDPELLYTTIKNLLNGKEPIIIRLEGAMFAPLYPILNNPNLHDSLRAVVLPAFKLPPNSKILNSDPVTITALIILAIIILGLPLALAMGISMVAIFGSLSGALLYAAIKGRQITANPCAQIGAGGSVPGGVGPNITGMFCTAINIAGEA